MTSLREAVQEFVQDGNSLALEGFNLLDEEASDIEYLYESRLPGEAEPVEDIHFHPAEPRSVRLVVEWRR